MKVIYEEFRCKFCDSPHLVKFGKFRGVQRYFCKDCKRKFADNDALPNMRTPSEQIASALNMYYEGMSLLDIGTHLEQMHKNHAAKSSIYNWVERFSKEAIGYRSVVMVEPSD
jgi:transposase-like protein